MNTECFVAFSTSSGPLSGVIRAAEGSPYSHAAVIYWSVDYSAWWVIHSDFPRIAAIPLAQFLAAGNRVVELWEFPTVSLWTGVMRSAGDIGSDYDGGGLAGFGAIKFWNFFGRKTFPNVHDNPKLYFCSEWLYARVLPQGGVVLPSAPGGASTVTPFGLRQLFANCAYAKIKDPKVLLEPSVVNLWG